MADLSLLLREEKQTGLGQIVSADYNHQDHELALTNGATLQVYSNVMEDVQLRCTVRAGDGEQFVCIIYVEWTNAFLVLVAAGTSILRRILLADGSGFEDLGILCPDGMTTISPLPSSFSSSQGTLLAATKNSVLHELVTSDSAGGIRIWALRSALVVAARGSPTKKTDILRCPTRLHMTLFHALCVDGDRKRILAASTRAVKIFDALTGAQLAKFRHGVDMDVRFLEYIPALDHVLVYALSFDDAPVEVWSIANLKQIHLVVVDAPSPLLPTSPVTALCTTTASQAGVAAKAGLHSVLVLTRTSQLSLLPVSTSASSSPPVCHTVHLQSLALPSTTTTTIASDPHPRPKPYSTAFLLCNLQYAARDFITVVQSNATESCIRIVELLSMHSTSRMLSSSAKLFSLRVRGRLFDFAFNKPHRDIKPRRGYSLFGGTVATNSVQLFEDVALPVCELDLVRNEGVDMADKPAICFLEYSTLLAKCIVGWSDGVLDLFALSGKRWRMLKRPSGIGVMADCVCTFQLPSAASTTIALVAADAQGKLDTWSIEDHASVYMGTLKAHSERSDDKIESSIPLTPAHSIVSILNPLAMPPSGDPPTGVLMITTSFDGQIKLWSWTPAWSLVGLFKTYSINLSVAKLVDMHHMCCGCEAGAVELWKLPRHTAKDASLLTAKKPVVHCLAAHATTVSDVSVHHGVGATPEHDYTLVATLGRDRAILFWYFAVAGDAEMLVPFRVVVASAPPCGGYFSSTASPTGVSYLCCLGNSVERVVHLPRAKKHLLAVVMQASYVPESAAPSSLAQHTPLTHDTSGASSLYQPMDVPLQLTIPVVDIHVTFPSSDTPVAAPHATARLAMTMKMGQDTVLGVPLGQATSLSSLEEGSNRRNSMAGATPEDGVTGGLIRRNSLGGQSQQAIIPRAYRNLTLRANAPRVYRPPREPKERKKVGTSASMSRLPYNVHVVHAFGVGDDAGASMATPRLEQRRRGVVQVSAVVPSAATTAMTTAAARRMSDIVDTHGDADDGARPIHVIEMATRPPTNPYAPLFWLESNANHSHHHVPGSPHDDDSGGCAMTAQAAFDVETIYIGWDDLSPDQQFVEVQASLWTKSIVAMAAVDGVERPQPSLATPTAISDKIAYHKYASWYARKSTARVVFLREELAFGTTDDAVLEQAQCHGVALPKLSDSTSVNIYSPMFFRWCRYVAWYSKGVFLEPHDVGSLASMDWTASRARLDERTDVLRTRLHEIECALHGFQKLQAKALATEEAARKAAAAMLFRIHKNATNLTKPTLPPDLARLDVDFFHPIVLPSGQILDFVPWESLSLVEQQKELALAMTDVYVRWEAMKQHVTMPDVLSALTSDDLDDHQLTTRCEAFIAWWSQPNNPARVRFLKHEAHEAAKDAQIHAAASRAGVDLAFHSAIKLFTHTTVAGAVAAPGADDDDLNRYHDWYFAHSAASARVDFLKQKMVLVQRKKRFHLVLDMGRLPAPILWSMTPPILLATDVDDAKAPTAATTQVVVDEPPPPPATIDAAVSSTTAAGDADALERLAREQWEAQMLTWNRAQMETEDALAQTMRLMDDDDDDADDGDVDANDAERAPRVFQERDYSTSYFFASMPGAGDAAHVASLGWTRGCGLDNGDEEADERDVREMERQRQLELDALDRVRIAEEERVAALALAEQMREDERKAQKRARQLEVKRILQWQREETARREIEATQRRLERECAAMAAEEGAERRRLDDLARERREMACADAESRETWARRADRDRRDHEARAKDRRRMLHEDMRSRHAAAHAADMVRQAAARHLFLRELYTPFEPHFPDNDDRRCLRTSQTRRRQRRSDADAYDVAASQHRRPMSQQAAGRLVSGQYTVPFVDETPETEVYQVQPSHKFQTLVGLPIDYRRPASSHHQNVVHSLDTLTRARSVPGLLARPLTSTTASSRGLHHAKSNQQLHDGPTQGIGSSDVDMARLAARTASRRIKAYRRRTPDGLAPLGRNKSTRGSVATTMGLVIDHSLVDDDTALFRESKLPPPFFRGHLGVVGQHPQATASPLVAHPSLFSTAGGAATPNLRAPQASSMPTSDDYDFGRPPSPTA
ncbi:Aste57867_15911 [Aphanomyces stellatus]|uniref:Aste57867_15911 protein n=1 Tax=Aphanomyces stellatus TaxID=120398 RepID=A0A485L4J1_9STRA|nr:hypothetical protein As57867_015855 [Aphanomyces stellatus]VFT92697.1 Aste57867_15911 [Aphanomyces stellatus]